MSKALSIDLMHWMGFHSKTRSKGKCYFALDLKLTLFYDLPIHCRSVRSINKTRKPSICVLYFIEKRLDSESTNVNSNSLSMHTRIEKMCEQLDSAEKKILHTL